MSYIHFRLPPLIVPPWPVLTVCDHGQGWHSPWLLHTASSFITRRPHSLSWTARIHRVLYCPAGRDGERRAAQYTCGFLSLPLNLGQCARGWPSAHLSKASYTEAVHEPHQRLVSLARQVLWSQVRRVRLGGDLLHCEFRAAHRLGATGAESRCASLCPTIFCLLWTVTHPSRCATGRLHPGLWRTPELPSTLLLHACQRAVLHRRCWWPRRSAASSKLLIRCLPCKIMLPLTDFLDCRSPAQFASAKAMQGVWITLSLRQAPNPRPFQ